MRRFYAPPGSEIGAPHAIAAHALKDLAQTIKDMLVTVEIWEPLSPAAVIVCDRELVRPDVAVRIC